MPAGPRRSRSDWQELIEQQRQSGLSVKGVCHQNGLNPKSFYRYRKQFNGPDTDSGSVFIKVESPSASLTERPSCQVELHYRDCHLKWSACSPDWLAQLLKAL